MTIKMLKNFADLNRGYAIFATESGFNYYEWTQSADEKIWSLRELEISDCDVANILCDYEGTPQEVVEYIGYNSGEVAMMSTSFVQIAKHCSEIHPAFIIKQNCTQNLKWCVLDESADGVDGFEEVCESREQAIDEAHRIWHHLTELEQRKRTIRACVVNTADDSDGDVYHVAWENGKQTGV